MESNTDNNPASRPRITPRNSDLDESITTADTPWRTLNQLANLPRTPLRRASSAGAPSTHRSQRRTPIAIPRGGSAKRPVAVTPHGRAAQRDMDIRRAGLTPGHDRRRSGRQQRETPRDALRALSRILAPKTAPIIPTPQGQHTTKHPLANEDWEDGPDLVRPRFSLPFGEEEDDDESLLLPPRSAGLEDENFTVQSVEFGRRAHSERPLGRMSRGSFGSAMMSDNIEDSRLDRMSEMFDSSIFPENGRGDVPFLGEDEELRGEYTGVLAGFGMDRGRISLAGRDSDIQPLNASERDDTETFVFNVPPRAITEEASSPLPFVEASPVQFDSNQDEEEVEVDDLEQDVTDNIIEILDDNDEDDEEDEDPVDDINNDGQDTSMLQDLDVDLSMAASKEVQTAALTSGKTARKKKVKISKHGIQYPSLPAGVVKKLATTFARTAGNSKSKLSKETLDAIMQASEWFFEQASDDLGAYSGHAGRKTIEESDVVTLMTRQRQINATTTPFSLAQKNLPRELLQELRMVPPSKLRGGRKLPRVEEEEEEGIEVDE